MFRRLNLCFTVFFVFEFGSTSCATVPNQTLQSSLNLSYHISSQPFSPIRSIKRSICSDLSMRFWLGCFSLLLTHFCPRCEHVELEAQRTNCIGLCSRPPPTLRLGEQPHLPQNTIKQRTNQYPNFWIENRKTKLGTGVEWSVFFL